MNSFMDILNNSNKWRRPILRPTEINIERRLGRKTDLEDLDDITLEQLYWLSKPGNVSDDQLSMALNQALNVD